MKASLNRVISNWTSVLFWTWIMEDCESAARSLCVEWVANVVACGDLGGLPMMKWRDSRRRIHGSLVGVPSLIEMQNIHGILNFCFLLSTL